MQAGVEELSAKAAVVIFVDPQQALSKIRETRQCSPTFEALFACAIPT